MKKIINQADIAKAVGVSKGTVDRALHNRKGINDEVKLKILRAAKELGYKPNRAARLLSLKKPKNIGIIYPENPRFFWDQVNDGLRTAENELNGFGISTTHRRFEILKDRYESDVLLHIDQLLKEDADAIVIMPIISHKVTNKVKELNELGITVVTFTHEFEERDYRAFHIGSDLKQSGTLAADLMAKFIGNTNGTIVGIRNANSYRSSKLRLESFSKMLRDQRPEIKQEIFEYRNIISQHDSSQIKDLLLAAPNLIGVYDSEGSSLADVAEIVRDLGLSAKITVIGHELHEGLHSYLADDTVTATICQQPFIQGYYAIKILYEYLINMRRPETDFLYSKLDIITKYNVGYRDTLINCIKNISSLTFSETVPEGKDIG